MQHYNNLKEHYQFTNVEAQLLKNNDIIAYHRKKIKEWFINLFCGKYDMPYFMYLYKIGEIHVKIGLPTHYVNSAFTYVRTFILASIEENFKDKQHHVQEIRAVEKIVDMNLDVLTSSYREEELNKFLSLSKIEKNILLGLKNFNSYINYFLAGALAIVAFFAIGLFVYDIYLLFFTDIKIEKGILTVLGSLLVLWASIELIHEEINHLQGKGFAIGAFIMLAMAALIRKILIYSLSSEKGEDLLVIAAVIVGLSISYWLIGTNKKQV